HVQVELRQRALEVHAIAGIAIEQHEAEWIEIDLVGLRGEVVRALQKVLAVRDHMLAAATKFADGGGELFEFDLPDAAQIIGVDLERRDALIGSRGANRGCEIPQQRLRRSSSFSLA